MGGDVQENGDAVSEVYVGVVKYRRQYGRCLWNRSVLYFSQYCVGSYTHRRRELYL